MCGIIGYVGTEKANNILIDDFFKMKRKGKKRFIQCRTALVKMKKLLKVFPMKNLILQPPSFNSAMISML